MTLADLYEKYGNRCFQGRNDFDQSRVLLAFLTRSYKVLEEKQRLERAVAKDACVDVVINKVDGVTEVYVPVKKDQKGSLFDVVLEHCQTTVKSVGSYDAGVYKKFVVLRTVANVGGKDLAEKLIENVPSKLKSMNVTLVPAYRVCFDSQAEYENPLPVVTTAHKNGTRPPKQNIPKDVLRVVGKLVKDGKCVSDAYAALPSFERKQVEAIWRHTKMGTYDLPFVVVDDPLYVKLCAGFVKGSSNEELANKYGLNKFQVIAQRAKFTRQKSFGGQND
jgi:hypothetical protein